MILKMFIAGELFIEIDFDFEGKATDEARQEHLEEIAKVLATEYAPEIERKGGHDQYFYEVESAASFIEVTDFELRRLEIKLQAIRFRKQAS